MVDLDLWLAYVGTVLVIVFAPGPSVLLVSSHRMQHGRRAIWPTVAGDLSANMLQMLVAAVGLETVIQRSPTLLSVIQWVGVGYLMFLGLHRMLRPSGVRSGKTMKGREPATVTNRRLYLRGFVVSAANPKAVVFFASFFPLFLASDRAWLPQLSVLSVTFLALDGTALATYAHLGNRLRQWLRRSNRTHLEDWISGTLLIGAGTALAAKQLDAVGLVPNSR